MDTNHSFNHNCDVSIKNNLVSLIKLYSKGTRGYFKDTDKPVDLKESKASLQRHRETNNSKGKVNCENILQNKAAR